MGCSSGPSDGRWRSRAIRCQADRYARMGLGLQVTGDDAVELPLDDAIEQAELLARLMAWPGPA